MHSTMHVIVPGQGPDEDIRMHTPYAWNSPHKDSDLFLPCQLFMECQRIPDNSRALLTTREILLVSRKF